MENVTKREMVKAVLKNGEGWLYGVCALVELGCAVYFGAYALSFAKLGVDSNKFAIQELKIKKD